MELQNSGLEKQSLILYKTVSVYTYQYLPMTTYLVVVESTFVFRSLPPFLNFIIFEIYFKKLHRQTPLAMTRESNIARKYYAVNKKIKIFYKNTLYCFPLSIY